MLEVLNLNKNNCADCYKCIRHCPVKSIKYSTGQAQIVSDECILCGQCFVVCPQNAKQVHSEAETVERLLADRDKRPVVASLAPSFVSGFPSDDPEKVKAALYGRLFCAPCQASREANCSTGSGRLSR